MKLVWVIGAGFMGAGIAQVCAQSGYRVVLSDIKPAALKTAQKGIAWSVGKQCPMLRCLRFINSFLRHISS